MDKDGRSMLDDPGNEFPEASRGPAHAISPAKVIATGAAEALAKPYTSAGNVSDPSRSIGQGNGGQALATAASVTVDLHRFKAIIQRKDGSELQTELPPIERDGFKFAPPLTIKRDYLKLKYADLIGLRPEDKRAIYRER